MSVVRQLTLLGAAAPCCGTPARSLRRRSVAAEAPGHGFDIRSRPVKRRRCAVEDGERADASTKRRVHGPPAGRPPQPRPTGGQLPGLARREAGRSGHARAVPPHRLPQPAGRQATTRCSLRTTRRWSRSPARRDASEVDRTQPVLRRRRSRHRQTDDTRLDQHPGSEPLTETHMTTARRARIERTFSAVAGNPRRAPARNIHKELAELAEPRRR